MSNFNSSFPFPRNIHHEPNKADTEDVKNLIKRIPSKGKTQDDIENEKKLARAALKKKEEFNKKITLESNASKSREKQNTGKETHQPVIKGRATLKILCELDSHQLCCEYNQDYTFIASGGVDGVVKIFTADTGDCSKIILGGRETQGQTACVTSLHHKSSSDATNNDRLFCTYVNGVVKCFNLHTSECIFTKIEGRQTYGLLFHPRLPKFITYGDDLKINFYDLETLTKERVYESSMYRHLHDGHTSRIFAGCFHPKSNYEFLTGGWDDTVLLWDIRQPHGVRNISGVHICGEGVDIDADGTKVLTCSWRESDQLQVWDYATFKLITTMLPDSHSTKLYCGKFINQEFLVCGGGDPALVRVVDRNFQKSKVVISNLPSNACYLNTGKPKAVPFSKRRSKSKVDVQADEAVSRLPNIITVSGNRIYEINFPLISNQ